MWRNILHSHQEIANKSSNIMNSKITLSPNMWETESSKSIRYRLALIVFTNKTILRKFWFKLLYEILKAIKKKVTFCLKCKLHLLSLTKIHFSSLTSLSLIELSKFQIYSMQIFLSSFIKKMPLQIFFSHVKIYKINKKN